MLSVFNTNAYTHKDILEVTDVFITLIVVMGS